MIRSSNADLPVRQDQGTPPDSQPRFLPTIIGAWLDNFEAARDAERGAGSGSVLWASDAGSCARRLSYDIAHRMGGDSPSNPFTQADRFRFALGTLVHGQLEQAIEAAFPGSEAEVRGSYDDPALTFRADAIIKTAEGKTIAAEWKSCGGFAYKRMATGGKTPAEGPRLSAFLQGAIAAKRVEADELVVGYVALELLSPAEAKRQGMSEVGRFCSEWTYGPDQFIPAADAELARLGSVLDAVKVGLPVPRVIPSLPLGAEVVDPATGRWEVRSGDHIINAGSAWECKGYCSWADRCCADKEKGV